MRIVNPVEENVDATMLTKGYNFLFNPPLNKIERGICDEHYLS